MAETSSEFVSRYPVTLWPTAPLEPKPVQRSAVVVGDDGMLVWGAGLEAQKLPDEWVLRQLRDADLDDDTAVAALLNEYGRIKGPYSAPGFIPDDAGTKLGDDWGDTLAVEASEHFELEDGTTIEDARWYLKTARALAGTWAHVGRDEDPVTVWADEGFRDRVVDSLDPELHWDMFTGLLNEGLASYHAHAATNVWGAGAVGLYSAACLQVFNLIVGKCDAFRCENEPCPIVFAHQIGGAKLRQFRSKGLRFCSPKCARDQTQREYRRRRKAKEREEQS
jgi:hypothetical protein